MRPKAIRPIVICVVRDGERIFVSEDVKPDTGEVFYRPLGGGIERGERSADAVVRELREEIGAELVDLRVLGAIENIFTYNGELGHEIVVVYEAQFADRSLYERERVNGWDGVHNEQPLVALWKPLRYFVEGHAPLYPDGLFELLTEQPHAAIIGRMWRYK
jgi:8-oxo-dGTP pyrophosphatase MutT (NUDIX family)